MGFFLVYKFFDIYSASEKTSMQINHVDRVLNPHILPPSLLLRVTLQIMLIMRPMVMQVLIVWAGLLI